MFFRNPLVAYSPNGHCEFFPLAGQIGSVTLGPSSAWLRPASV